MASKPFAGGVVGATTETSEPAGSQAPPPPSVRDSTIAKAPTAALESCRRTADALTALAALISSATDATVLLEESAIIAARTLRADHFAVCRARRDAKMMGLSIGLPADDVEQREVVTYEVPRSTPTSIFRFALDEQCALDLSSHIQDAQCNDTLLPQLGLRGAAVCPLPIQGEEQLVLGALTSVPRRFEEQDLSLLATMSQMLANAWDALRCQATLGEYRRFVSRTFDSMRSLVAVLDSGGRVTQINDAFGRCTGHSMNSLRDSHLTSTILPTEEIEPFENAIQAASKDEKPVVLRTAVVAANGGRRFVEWSIARLGAGRGTVVITGTDLTTEVDLQNQLRSVLAKLRATSEAAANPEADDDTRPEPVRPPLDAEARRRDPRRPYPTVQLIAPFDDGVVPDLSQFIEVRCRDISAGGFSFYLSEEPSFRRIVVVFGGGAARIPLIAEVMHSSPIKHPQSTEYVVGCRYISRAVLGDS